MLCHEVKLTRFLFSVSKRPKFMPQKAETPMFKSGKQFVRGVNITLV